MPAAPAVRAAHSRAPNPPMDAPAITVHCEVQSTHAFRYLVMAAVDAVTVAVAVAVVTVVTAVVVVVAMAVAVTVAAIMTVVVVVVLTRVTTARVWRPRWIGGIAWLQPTYFLQVDLNLLIIVDLSISLLSIFRERISVLRQV